MDRLLVLLMLAAVFALPRTVHACPICSEGIEASASGEDADDFPNAMNQSIYLMVAVPYLSLGFAGFFIYRGCQKNAAHTPEDLARPCDSNRSEAIS